MALEDIFCALQAPESERNLFHSFKYRKILLSFGMEMGHLPCTDQSAGRKAPKRAHNNRLIRFTV